MRILGINFGRKKEERSEITSSLGDHNSHFVRLLESRSKPMLLSTVYRCVDLISDSVAVLPLETYMVDSLGYKQPHYNAPIYDILNLEPNEGMTRFTFFKTLMASVLLTGNGYAYIERDSNNRVLQLEYLQSQDVRIVWIKDEKGKERKRYEVKGREKLIEPQDMIHVLNFSYEGVTGVSTLTHARQTLGIATDSESHAAGFFKSGANTAGTLSVEGRLNEKQKDEIYKTWAKRTDPVTGNPNGIVVLEGNMKYQPITVSPKDSQLLESRQFNVVDICRFFSVSPVKAFDLSKSSYSTVEATQLEFLADTALAVITKIELEINRKVFLPSERKVMRAEFNTAAILRTDKKAQGDYLSKMFQVGGITSNEIRRELNFPKVDGGDKAFVQVNVQTLENAAIDRPSPHELDKNNPINKDEKES